MNNLIYKKQILFLELLSQVNSLTDYEIENFTSPDINKELIDILRIRNASIKNIELILKDNIQQGILNINQAINIIKTLMYYIEETKKTILSFVDSIKLENANLQELKSEENEITKILEEFKYNLEKLILEMDTIISKITTND